MKKNEQEMALVDADVEKQEKLNQELLSQVEKLQAEYNKLEDRKIDLIARIDDAYLQKQAVRNHTLSQQAYLYSFALNELAPIFLIHIHSLTLPPFQNLERITTYQQRSKKYESVLDGKYRPSIPVSDLSNEIAKQVQQTEKIKQVLGKLRDENPKYQHWFKRLLSFIN